MTLNDLSRAYLPVAYNPLQRKIAEPLFIYLPLNKRGLAAKQRWIVKELGLSGIKPTSSTNFHITCVFVENCSDSTITQILKSFRAPRSVSLEVTSVEVLEGGDSPALVWRVDPDSGLVRLQADLYRALLGEVDGISEYSIPGKWLAHITIAYDLPTVPAKLPQIKPFKLTADRFVVGRDEFRTVATVKLDGGARQSKGFVEKLYSTELEESNLYTILKGEQVVVGPMRRVLDLQSGPFSIKGGEGSGNFDHAGRPGEVGGSQSEEGGAEPIGERPPYGSRRPSVDWKERDLQDTSSRVNEDTIRHDYANDDSNASIYQAWIPIRDLPSPILGQDEGVSEGDRGWLEEYNARDTFPPVKIGVKPDGDLEIIDGNHRIAFWEAAEFEYAPAWVVDRRSNVLIEEGMVERGGEGSGHHGHAGRPGERGGSVPGEGEAVSGGREVYHGTNRRYAKAILAKGLSRAKSNDGYVWAATYRQLAREYAMQNADRKPYAVVVIDRTMLGDPRPPNEFDVHYGEQGKRAWDQDIPAEAIIRVEIWSNEHGETEPTEILTNKAESDYIFVPVVFDDDDYVIVPLTDMVKRGGPGSGFAGHAGRPGEVGGSRADGGTDGMTKRHLGPGPHPSGSEQSEHAGNGGGTTKPSGKKSEGKAKEIYEGSNIKIDVGLGRRGVERAVDGVRSVTGWNPSKILPVTTNWRSVWDVAEPTITEKMPDVSPQAMVEGYRMYLAEFRGIYFESPDGDDRVVFVNMENVDRDSRATGRNFEDDMQRVAAHELAHALQSDLDLTDSKIGQKPPEDDYLDYLIGVGGYLESGHVDDEYRSDLIAAYVMNPDAPILYRQGSESRAGVDRPLTDAERNDAKALFSEINLRLRTVERASKPRRTTIVLEWPDGKEAITVQDAEARTQSFEDEFAKLLTLTIRGGPESGHYGHAGRPGEVGGSAPGEGGGRVEGGGKVEGGAKVHAAGFDARDANNTYAMARKVLTRIEGDAPVKDAWVSPTGEAYRVQDGHNRAAMTVIMAMRADGDESFFERYHTGYIEDPEELFIKLGWMRVAGSLPGGLGLEWQEDLTESQKEVATRIVLHAERNGRQIDWESMRGNGNIEALKDQVLGFKSLATRGGPGSGHFTHDGRPGQIGGSVGGLGGPATFDEASERAAVQLPYVGQTAKLKEGITREQGQRFFDRRNAARSAEKFKYRDGSTSREVIDAKLLEGGTTIRRERFYYELTNRETGQSMRFTRSEERDYIDTLMNHGRFARNYDLVERGGPGSGHHGHAGRQGEVGGSAPGEGTGSDARKVSEALSLTNGEPVTPEETPDLLDRGNRFWLDPDGDLFWISGVHADAAMEAIEFAGLGSFTRDYKGQVDASQWMLNRGFTRVTSMWPKQIGIETKGITDQAIRTLREVRVVNPEWSIVVDSRFGEPAARRIEAAITRGGPGSGHYEHAGRPGEVGGSSPGEGDGKRFEASTNINKSAAARRFLQERITEHLGRPVTVGHGVVQEFYDEVREKAPSAMWIKDEQGNLLAVMAADGGAYGWSPVVYAIGGMFATKVGVSGITGEEGRGSGLGTAFMEAVKDYVDASDKELLIHSVANQGFFNRFDWLTPGAGGLKYEYVSPGRQAERDRLHEELKQFAFISRGTQTKWDLFEAEEWLEAVGKDSMTKRHLGPGPHPSGSEQSEHAGNGGGTTKPSGKKSEGKQKEIYHGTGARAARSIMKTGLQVGRADSNNVVDGVVFAASSYEMAHHFASRSTSKNYAIITIDPSLAGSKPERGPIGGELMFDRDIPAGAIIKIDIYERGEMRRDDRILETIERTLAKPVLYAAASIDESDNFTLLGPTLDDMTRRHLGPGPHPSGSEQTVHAGGGGGEKKEGEKKGKAEAAGSAPKEKGVRSPEALSRASTLFTAAVEAETRLTPLMESIAQNTGGKLEGLDHAIKEEEALAGKIDRDAAERGLSHEDAAQAVTDANRYTMTFESDNYVKGVLSAQAELETNGYSQYDDKWRNYFVPGDPYDGYNSVYINHETGERFEVQFHTPETLVIKNEVHGLYKEFHASPEGSPERLALWDRMQEAWEGYEKPPGWETLPGRAIVQVTQ